MCCLQAFGKGKMLALSMREKEEALEHFVRDGWLVKTPQARGFFSLGVSNHRIITHPLTGTSKERPCIYMEGV